MIVGDYKSGTSDNAAYVLASGSFADLVQRVDEVNRLNSSSADLLRQIRGAQTILARQRRALGARLRRGRASRSPGCGRRAAASTAPSPPARRCWRGSTPRSRARSPPSRLRRNRLAGVDGGPPPPPGAGGGHGGFTGEASWYGPGFAGHRTADGEIFDPNKLTAASPWLPFNTMLRVTDLATGRSVVVRINDRGPFGRGVLDLSAHAAQIVGLSGWAEVQATIL